MTNSNASASDDVVVVVVVVQRSEAEHPGASFGTRRHRPIPDGLRSARVMARGCARVLVAMLTCVVVAAGKTLCYAVPLVQNLQGLQSKVQRSDGPLALVIVPTREVSGPCCMRRCIV